MASKNTKYKQQGAILIVALVMLMVLTLLGVSGITTTQMQERMAGNEQENAYAFETAEAILRTAEQYIENNVTSLDAFDTDGTDGLYNSETDSLWSKIDWEGSDSSNNLEAIMANDTSNNIKGAYIIEHFATFQVEQTSTTIGDTGSKGVSSDSGLGSTSSTSTISVSQFRITARGLGAGGRGRVYLQANYGKAL